MSKSLEQKVQLELLREFARLSYAGSVVYPTLFLIVCLLDEIGFNWFVKGSFLVVLLLSLLRFGAATRVLRSASSPRWVAKLLKCTTLGQIVVWSLFSGITMFLQGDYRNWSSVFLLLIASGLAPAGAFALAADRLVSRAFLFALWICHAPLLLGDLRSSALVFLGTIYLLYWDSQSKRQFERLVSSVTAQESLRLQKEELEEANFDAQQARQITEKALAQALDANLAKSRFLATVSHEIRTPLHGVLGMNTILLDTELDEEQLDCARTIHNSGTALLSVINEVLDFSKLEAGHEEFHRERFQLTDFLSQTHGILKQRAKEKKLGFDLQIDPEVPDWVQGDPAHLRQVLLNLLSNAIKFTDAGRVTMKVTCREQFEDGFRIEMAVSDTGIGISLEDEAILFEPFQQVNSSTTRTRGGTGLGLPISKQLVELMGGSLSYSRNQESSGSTFSLLLPFESADSDELEDSMESVEQTRLRKGGKKSLILVAEDNPTNQKILTRLLSRAGFEFELVHNGREAFEAVVSDREFSLVLMDCHMPVMDGLEATEAIIQTLGDEAPPIVAVTATTSSEGQRQCREAGMRGFLAKPVRIRQLQEVLDEFLGD